MTIDSIPSDDAKVPPAFQFSLRHCLLAMIAVAVLCVIYRAIQPLSGSMVLGMMMAVTAWCAMVGCACCLRCGGWLIVRFWDWHARRHRC